MIKYYIVVGQYQNWVEVKKAGFQAGGDRQAKSSMCKSQWREEE